MANSVFDFGMLVGNVEVLGDKDGVNRDFYMPSGDKYLDSTLMVYLNGQLYRPDEINKTSSTHFTIMADHVPISTDVLTATYVAKK